MFDVAIVDDAEVIDHPEDRVSGLGPAKEIALSGMMHLGDGEVAGIDEGLKEIEVVSPTDIDHGHGGKSEVNPLLHFGPGLLTERTEGVAKYFVYFHVTVLSLARVSLYI